MRRFLVVVVLVATATVASTGCGQDGPPPRSWARSVCTALGPWRTSINTLNAQAQQQITARTTAAQTKEQLLALLAGGEQASESARSKVSAAGTPDVSGGAEIARRFQASLTKARDAYGAARQAVGQLPTTSSKVFYDGVVAAFTKLNTDYAASGFNTADVQSKELQKAFREVPECR